MRTCLFIALAAACLLSGCGGPEETEPLSPVYTDWSQLEPYAPPEPLYTHFEPYSGSGTLQAREDYGLLLPYIGSYLETDSYMGSLCTLGLVTADGQLVTDPVYAEIQMAGAYQPFYGPFLLLYRGEVYGYEETAWGTYVDGGFSLTVAAPDGSWVRDLGTQYINPQVLEGDRLALTGRDGSALILNSDGSDGTDFPASALEPYLGEGFQWTWEGGPELSWDGRMGKVWRYDENNPDGDGIVCWLDPDTGAVTADPPAGYTAPESPEASPPSFAGYESPSPLEDPVTGKRYYYARQTEGDVSDLLDSDGQVLLAGCDLPYWTMGIGSGGEPWVWGDRIACAESGDFCYYDLSGQLVFRWPIRLNDD